MIRIQVRPNEPLETALRRFKRQCNYAGIFRLAKKASVYEKPSERRRRESRDRIRNVQRALRKAMQFRRARKKLVKRNYTNQPDKPGEGTATQAVSSSAAAPSAAVPPVSGTSVASAFDAATTAAPTTPPPTTPPTTPAATATES